MIKKLVLKRTPIKCQIGKVPYRSCGYTKEIKKVPYERIALRKCFTAVVTIELGAFSLKHACQQTSLRQLQFVLNQLEKH